MREILVTENPDHSKGQISFEERELQLKEQEQKEAEARKREKNSPFTRWTQFNNDHTKEMMTLARNNPAAMTLLLFLVDQMDNKNAVVCSMQVLTEALGYSRRTISSSVKYLKDNGFVAVLKSGTTNVYTINDKVWWKSWGNNRQYSKFPANVVLAKSEQIEDDFKVDTEKLKVIKGIAKKKQTADNEIDPGEIEG